MQARPGRRILPGWKHASCGGADFRRIDAVSYGRAPAPRTPNILTLVRTIVRAAIDIATGINALGLPANLTADQAGRNAPSATATPISGGRPHSTQHSVVADEVVPQSRKGMNTHQREENVRQVAVDIFGGMEN